MNKQIDKEIRTNDVYDKFPLSAGFDAAVDRNFSIIQPDNTTCEELDREFADFFAYLHSVSGAETGSLEQLLDTAIEEEERFFAWQDSRLKLKNVQLFHKKNGALRLIDKTGKFPYFTRFFRTSARLDLDEVNESSQLEVWECGRNREPRFPLFRFFLDKLRNEGEFVASEKLRDDYALTIQAEETSEHVSLHVSLFNPAKKESLAEKIENYFAGFQLLYRRIFEQYKRCFASFALLAFLGTTLTGSLACSNNHLILAGVKREQSVRKGYFEESLVEAKVSFSAVSRRNLTSRNFEERLGEEQASQFVSFAQRLAERQQKRLD